ncbi:transferase activity protein [[Candida] boidinii]|nr:transferase activity protein [[Candida] boidinii]
MAKKKTSSLLKRQRGITGGSVASNSIGASKRPSSLKPLRARQLIRRFHILLKNKSSIISRLSNLSGLELTESDYLTKIKGKKLEIYKKHKADIIENLKVNKTPDNADIISQASISDLTAEILVNKLGEIDGEIDKRGGLETYQVASTLGQNSKRGGDSSKKLIEWLRELKIYENGAEKPTALEIGCLSSTNLISTSKIFQDVVKIDLNSQEPGIILKQDFMTMDIPPVPEKFNLISCSLVLNFVPTPKGRGDMLIRMTKFLTNSTNIELPSLLFLVLPLPCVSNSRYCDNDQLDKIMTNLGFEKIKYQEAKKVSYWLWKWNGSEKLNKKFKASKKELHKGGSRNNFCIVIG